MASFLAATRRFASRSKGPAASHISQRMVLRQHGAVNPRRAFATETKGKQTISFALYRQLLRWCDETEDDLPLSYFIPPVYMKPPQIDKESLRILASGDENSRLQPSIFPPNTAIDEHQMTIPIHTCDDAKAFLRGVFRLNASPAKPEDQKERISLAFDGLKSLHELTMALEDFKKNRERHIHRDNVNFRVGQVVKHKVEDWRAVITGWVRIIDQSSDESTQATSLTKKTYELDPADEIKYTLVLDSGDAHLHYSKRRESGNNLSIAEVHQTDLVPVEEESLLRIRNSHIKEHFKHFDARTNMFVPNEIVAYEYPSDKPEDGQQQAKATIESDKVAEDVISGVQGTAFHLRDIIMGYTSAPESRGLKLLALFLEKLTTLSDGDVLPVKDRFSTEPVSKSKLAALHLQQLFNSVVNVGELLWQNRRSVECDRTIKYGLGAIVKHKEYGFRGVVVAWDPQPAVDVSRWDGLQNIKDPHQYPFYHVIPDQSDCVQAFGGERLSKYVCEENLEICPPDQRNVEVDLAPEWNFNHSDGVYTAPDDLKFKYGEGLDDDGLTERCLIDMKAALARMFVSSRDATKIGEPELDALCQKMAMNNLLEMLKISNDMEIATIISESLKEMWKAHTDTDLRWKLDTGIGHLLSGNTEHALACFTELIDEDPTYAEAWNKASTCEFMLGNMEASMGAARKTLENMPSHFQAQNGLGLVYFEKKELPSAVECFRKSIELDPWSPVSARLSVCLDQLKQWEGTSVKKANES